MRRVLVISSILFLFACEKPDLKLSYEKNLELLTIRLAEDSEFADYMRLCEKFRKATNRELMAFDDAKVLNSLSNVGSIKPTASQLELLRAAGLGDGKIVRQDLQSIMRLGNLLGARYPFFSKIKKNDAKKIWNKLDQAITSSDQTVNEPFESDGKATLKKRRSAASCVGAYVDGESDCDVAFAFEVGFSILGGGVSSFLSTPIGGIGVAVSGIGAAYAAHLVCMRPVIRAYRACMGYTP
ncbi:MAG: hypothetical protein EAY75_16390 [Bacteroidetes bacterium]|nr:MAG: hypothetical protein EAY75_16390 [Bacteroidota bacterium]